MLCAGKRELLESGDQGPGIRGQGMNFFVRMFITDFLVHGNAHKRRKSIAIDQVSTSEAQVLFRP